MPSPPDPRPGRFARAAAAIGSLQTRQRRLEERLERRFPTLYDARHAAAGIGRALGPLVLPFLAALVLLPIFMLVAAIVAWLGIEAPSVDLPSVDLPDVSFPDVPFPELDAPGWLEAIGATIVAVLEFLLAAGKYVVVAGWVLIGLKRTRDERRRRTAAEAVGRPELCGDWPARWPPSRRTHARGAPRRSGTILDDHSGSARNCFRHMGLADLAAGSSPAAADEGAR